jgi:hypothetical protein
MIPLCADEGVQTMIYSPLARGKLARPWGQKTARSESEPAGAGQNKATADSDRSIVEAVGAIAEERGVSQALVALAWLRRNPVVAARSSALSRLGISTMPWLRSRSRLQMTRRPGSRRFTPRASTGRRYPIPRSCIGEWRRPPASGRRCSRESPEHGPPCSEPEPVLLCVSLIAAKSASLASLNR